MWNDANRTNSVTDVRCVVVAVVMNDSVYVGRTITSPYKMLYNNYTVVNKIKVVNKSGIRFMDHRVIAERHSESSDLRQGLRINLVRTNIVLETVICFLSQGLRRPRNYKKNHSQVFEWFCSQRDRWMNRQINKCVSSLAEATHGFIGQTQGWLI